MLFLRHFAGFDFLEGARSTPFLLLCSTIKMSLCRLYANSHPCKNCVKLSMQSTLLKRHSLNWNVCYCLYLPFFFFIFLLSLSVVMASVMKTMTSYLLFVSQSVLLFYQSTPTSNQRNGVFFRPLQCFQWVQTSPLYIYPVVPISYIHVFTQPRSVHK